MYLLMPTGTGVVTTRIIPLEKEILTELHGLNPESQLKHRQVLTL